MTDAERAQLLQIVQTSPPNTRQKVTIGDTQYFVQVPAQINSDTAFAMVGYGAGGWGDTIPCYKMAAANNDNVVLMSVANTHKYDALCDGMKYIATQYGNSTDPVIMGYSMTGKEVVIDGGNQAARTGTPAIVIESQPRNPHNWTQEQFNAMKDSTVITFDDSGYNWNGYYSELAKAGANVLKIVPVGSDHGTVNDVTYATGIYKIGQEGLDLSSLPTTVDAGGYTINVKYKFKYWDENGVEREFSSVEEAQAFLDSALEKCGVGGILGKISDYQYYDPNSYKSSAYKLDTSAGNNSTLASDLSLVMDGMNELSGIVKDSSLTKVGNNCTSTTAIPAAIFDTQNYLMGVHSTLSDNIGKETAVIANVAQAVYNLDAKLAQSTNGINGQVSAEKVNATLDQILNTDITIPYTSFSSPVDIKKATQGNAGKISKSDIASMLSGGKLTGPVADSLTNDTQDAKKAMDSIKSFQNNIASNTSLQGDIWKEVNAKLDNYNSLLDKRIQSNEKMQEAYEKALKLIEDYMGDYDELDDSKIPELKAKVTELKSEIESLQAKIDEMKEVCDTDSEGKSTNCHMEHVYSDSARAEFAAQIKKNEELIVELNKEIEKLEGLWEVINKAADIVNGAVDEIKADYTKGVQDVAVAAPEQVLASTEQQTGVTPVDTSTQTGTSPASTTGADTSSGGSYGGGDYSGGGYSGGGYGGYGGGSIESTGQTTSPTTNTTTFETAVQHNAATTNAVQSNTVTEPNNIAAPIEQNTPAQNQTIINNYYYNNNGGGRSSHSEPAPIIETNEPVVEETIEEPVIEEIVEEPVIEEVVEEPVIEEEIIEEPEEENVVILGNTDVIETTATAQKSNSALKALGVMAGVGVAAGAAAYAAKEMKKSSNDSENDDFDYDSSTEGYY